MGHIYKESQMDFDVLEDSFARLAYSTQGAFLCKQTIPFWDIFASMHNLNLT